jgi:hypothetical protein
VPYGAGVVTDTRVSQDPDWPPHVIGRRRYATTRIRSAGPLSYVFSPTGGYGPNPAPNVKKLKSADLVEFMRSEYRRWSSTGSSSRS